MDNVGHIHLTERQKESLLRFPLESIIKLTGKSKGEPKRKSGYLMLRSPFREDPNPSFAIYLNNNTWHDFGTGESGGVLKLLRMLEGYDTAQAFDWLSRQDPGFIPVYDTARQDRPARRESIFVIDSAVRGVSDPVLLQYAQSRCVGPEALSAAYQITLHYRSSSSVSPFTAIALPTVNGGWNFRNVQYKQCTQGGITLFSSRGEFTSAPSCDTVFITEGMFTHLSALQMFEGGRLPDMVCLNGVGNLSAAFDYISAHSRIMACLDNDEAGRQALARLEKQFPDRRIENCALLIAPSNDLNDYLRETLAARSSEEEKKISAPRRRTVFKY